MALEIITPAIIRSLETQYYSTFQNGYKGQQVFHEALATRIPSGSSSNTYGWLAQIPKAREWLGERLVHGLAKHGHQIVNRDFELTVGVDRNDIMDENVGSVPLLMTMMGQGMRKQPDDLLVELLQNGHLSTASCFDGQNFFDTDHPVNKFTGTGTQSNYKTSTAFTEDNLYAMIAVMAGYQGEDGRPLGVRPTHVVGPPALEKIFRKTLVANTIVNSSAAVDNVTKGMVEYIIIPELAGQDGTWYLMDLSRPIKPFVFQPRTEPNFISRTDVNDDNVFRHKRFEWGSDARNNMGYALWFLALKAAA